MATKLQRNYTDKALAEAVNHADSLADVIRTLGIKSNSGTYRALQTYISRLKLSTAHWTRHKRSAASVKRKLATLLVVDSPISGSNLKPRLLREKILANKCSICNQGPEWQGKKLTLQLDHIDGNNRDHRIENLRILCPNCHTQTTTYAGSSRTSTAIKTRCYCGARITRGYSFCKSCAALYKKECNPRTRTK